MDSLGLVPTSDMPRPSDLTDVSKENLMRVFGTCLRMQVLCEKENGIGLSAVQVGIPWRLFVVRGYEGAEYRYFAECEYEPADDSSLAPSIEGCLSIRTPAGSPRLFRLQRHRKVVVRGSELIVAEEKPVFKNVVLSLDGLYSIVFQHEIDHQKSILISDIGEPIEVWPC